ncbi:unnamed protein product [Rotaria socialis]|uniref:Protein JTB n=1 Tax=Rotaria socialis TaxID=392032 RepID=A0A820JPY1_9BILA|nr:unnamed protein product [Rotaria socialis]CAF3324169.1 unnamed protein product [Rotaria socialis]CAF3416600.1 unnamed protein product [Rotaria socialis]CAF3437778.1 unnamed protein product [Rotaria socialis]CAF3653703.1 unnamed protein product [Rotaria socialis]
MMFDSFTRRRLLFFLFAILFVILSILFFARIVPSYSKHSSMKNSDEQLTSECYLSEPVDVLTLCQKCTLYERRSKAKACLPTGYKELILCSKSNIKTIRSCPMPIHVQRQNFWLFESVMFIFALFAMANVNFRQKTLDKQMIERIKRQIGENDE